MTAKRTTIEKPNDKRRRGRAAKATNESAITGGGDLGFERTLGQAADKVRNNMDAAEYPSTIVPARLAATGSEAH